MAYTPLMPPRAAFTLMELAIVLVIIGLLAGGILLGRDLIRAAEIRKTYSQFQEIKTAINTFRTKYNCLPGDCANATDFFGKAIPGGGVCPADNGPPAIPTCNGNGDGLIDTTNQPNTPDRPLANETLLLWQHLADAGVIAGVYSGTTLTSSGNTGYYKVGHNCPPMYSNRFCWLVGSQSMTRLFDPGWGKRHSAYMWPLRPIPVPLAAAPSGISTFSGAESLAYDGKYDDGFPDTGSIRAMTAWYSGPLCTTDDGSGNYIYYNGTSPDCLLLSSLGL